MPSLASNTDAERFVLGSILLDDSFFDAQALEPDHFSLEKHRRIYSRMGELHARSEKIDRVTVAHELMKHSQLESCDGLSYLISLDDGLPQVPNLDSYVRIIRECSTLRLITLSGQHLMEAAMLPGADSAGLLKTASTQFLSMAAQDKSEMENPYDILTAEIERVGPDAFFGGGVQGIQTPIEFLNETIVGLMKSDLILVGARPSVGKTALMMQMAYSAALTGHGCAVFSLEMGKLALSLRIACSVANLDSHMFRLGMLPPHDQRKLMQVIIDLKPLPLWIDKSCRTVGAIHAAVRQMRTRRTVDAVFVDYIQLMGVDGRAENQNAKVSEISRGLKLMAEEFKIPVVALSQLSRPAKGTNPPPTLADLRDSGSLEQDADVVIFLHAPDGNGTGVRDMIVAKQRNGPVDERKLAFVGKYQRFEALTEERDENEGR